MGLMMRDELPKILRERLDDPSAVCAALGISKGSKRQAGGGLVILCPVHNEKSPSCSVRRAKDGAIGWKCFACSAGGDIFHLIAAVHGLDSHSDFSAVIEIAADLAGVSIPGKEPRTAPAIPIRRNEAPQVEPLSSAAFQEVIAPLMTIGRLDGTGLSASVCSYLDGRGLLEAARTDGWFRIDGSAGPMLRDMFGAERVYRCGILDDRGELCWPDHVLAIPWRDPSGTVQTIQRRHLGDCDPKRRYVFPTGRGPSHPYGIERLKGRGPIALVEGAVDVLAWRIAQRPPRYEMPLGVPGVSGWKSDWDALAHDRVVTIAYDDDEAGNREAAKLADRFYAKSVGAFRVRRATPTNAKDWADGLRASA